eukprot:CAMPEP_0116125374 /NCGR_PEP_ID=MMETSP0329-20121206/5778_1 /TAXON_ID=697910 /ORGANISM="Pseudo-nitzschia arenysensis, Strain B593" /LENGTH=740 /DNA_ID=CAMNT_0003619413 /DNA_START=191 /DNA_END=2413 /DNA_ORIENTATION=-
MSEPAIDEIESVNSPVGSPQGGDDHASEARKKASPITPTPVKKSKRQAERLARGAFAATLRKEEEENRLYQSKKAKTKKRPQPDSDSHIENNNNNNNINNNNSDDNNNNNSDDKDTDKDKTKPALSDGESSKEALQMVTPQTTKSMNSTTTPSPKKKSKGTPSSETGGQNGKRSRDKDKIGTVNRKRRKLVYKAISNPKRPIYGYALDLVSLVCNNAYSVMKNSNGSNKKSNPKISSSSPKNSTTPTANKNEDKATTCTNQPHMVLDRPRNGFTEDSEPSKERIMRLQLRQRFASAASVGMSPIEFARKLMKLWGGTLEQVYDETTTKYTNEKSSTPRGNAKNGDKKSGERKNNNCSSSPTKKNKSKGGLKTASDAQFGESSKTNGQNYNRNENSDSQHSNVFDGQGFGESTERIERSKKLLQRRHRKNQKKAEGKGATSSVAFPAKSETESSGKEKPSPLSSSKRKPVKRTPRKFTDDPLVPVLFKGMRLSHPDDEKNLNALHCFVRAKLLEVYVLKGERNVNGLHGKETKTENENEKKLSDTTETPNIVGIRCVFCGCLPKQERGKGQSMSTFFPKSMGEIYRGVCTWQRIHFPVCEHMPEDYRMEYKIRKERDLTRGRKVHWVKSAYDLGLRNVDSERNGLTYRPDSPYNLEEVLKIEVDPGGGRSSKTKKGSRERSRSSSKNAATLPSRDKIHGSAISSVVASADDEFELFGTDFDRSVAESKEAAVKTKRDDVTF